ncbi:Squamous cell carcinoma antigen recognized by T-cells 3, partial [Stegodyphus mimosarum]
MKTDGTQILDHVISVAISNPPPRKNKSVKFSSVTVSESLGGGSTIKGPRGRGRTQISLLPRSVLRPPVGKKNLPSSSKNMQNGQNSEAENSSEDRKPLRNSDFAEMLNK